MAIWQYDITLVPRAAVLRQHGTIPSELPGYRAVWNPEDVMNESYPNYWRGFMPPESFSAEIESLLSPSQSWSQDALMYGTEDGNTIKIWRGADITVRLDVRSPDLELLRAIIEFADKHNLLLVSDTRGQPLEPSFESVIEDIRSSSAYRFCKDPMGYIERLKDEYGEQARR